MPTHPRYRTEVVIPDDRSLFLLLPEGVPTGPARVTVEPIEASPDGPDEPDPIDADDEWWDDLEGD